MFGDPPQPAKPLVFHMELRWINTGDFTNPLLAQSSRITVVTDTTADSFISNIEVVQTVQDSAGSVPLVADKPTMVRVYIGTAGKGQPTGDRVSARLRGQRVGGASLGAISPRSRYRSVTPSPAGVADDRNDPAGSINFVLPTSWTRAGELDLEAEIEFETTSPDDDPSNNTAQSSVSFTPKNRLNVGYIPVCLSDERTAETICPQPSDMQYWDFLAERLFPLPEKGINYFEASPFVLSSALKPTFSNALIKEDPSGEKTVWLNIYAQGFLLRFLWQQTRWLRTTPLGADIDVFAFLLPRSTRLFVFNDDDDSGSEIDDLGPLTILPGFTDGPKGFFLATVDGDTAQGEVHFATGLAFQFGAQLAAAPRGFDIPDWPAPENSIAATDDNGSQDAVGFDVARLAFKPPSLKDFTAAAAFNEVWISGLNTQKMFPLIRFLGAALAPEPGRQQSTGEVLLTAANFRADGSRATIENLTRLQSALEVDPLSEGPYCVEVHATAGLFAQECFDVLTLQLADLPDRDEFVVASRLPFQNDATAIRLTFQGNELLSRTPSANVPTVNITAPTAGARWEGGMHTVSWTTQDADGDPLQYDVFASTDGGGNWQIVATNLHDTELSLDADLLVATDVHFQVLVNDGFHSAAAVVGPVVVATEPQIEAPLALDLGFVVVEDAAVGELPIRNSGTG